MNGDDQNSTDPLQPQEDHFSPTQDETKLSEDNATPAAPATDVPGQPVPDDHPATDDGVEESEAYSEGLGNAAGVTEQSVPTDTNVQPVELQPEDQPAPSQPDQSDSTPPQDPTQPQQ